MSLSSAAFSGAPGAEAGSESLAVLAEAVLALRSTRDVATACEIATSRVIDASCGDEFRLLRIDPRSGALRLLDEAGVETPYLTEVGGPVEWVIREQRALFEERVQRSYDSLLWSQPPGALAALPLFSGTELFGCLLIAFAAPRGFGPDDQRVLRVLADALALALARSDTQRSLDGEQSRRSEAERRLASEEETSSNLMSVVAHEIRTPLTAIKAYTETLIDSLANPHAPRERFLNIIDQECDRLSRLVADVLDLSRLEAGQRPLRLTRFDPAALAREVIDQLRPPARVRRIVVDLEVGPDQVIEADTDLIRRLFLNLLGNAVKFSPVGGRVQVRMIAQGDEWLAEIEDEGRGIPPLDLPRVFERFYRAGPPEGEETEGTGLGLAISRGIVDLHGGRIWAEPRSKGARFCIALPLRQLASPQARRVARSVLDRGDLRGLLEGTVEMVAAMMDAEIVSLMLVDPERGDLFVAASRGFEGRNLSLRRTLVRSGVAGSVAAWGRPVLVNNIETDRRFQRINHPQYSTKSLLSVPLRVEGEILGVVNVNNKVSRAEFDEDDLALLATLVERVGGAIERAYAHPDSVRTVEEASETIRRITRLKREGLLGARSSVGMARALARELGMNAVECARIGYVAAIHDLGMSAIHQRLMGIHGPLGADERYTLMQHPEAGAEMIRPLDQGTVCDMVLSHHERWDGGGYPRGLRESEIPMGARILAVVDAFESMTMGRPYRPPYTPDEAVAELRREAGSQFDPAVVEALVRLLEREGGARG